MGKERVSHEIENFGVNVQKSPLMVALAEI
jgi:hypothetical protein